ncbi:hypothetical protein R3P38DRAFT_766067 [Favolaschia claudopus]|uniref:Uncharacterized protein n=1 Tax=Favolaschia claudopus TaxID=2862362 RepID=A0AAV9Z3L1_9AGAR
MPVSLVGPIVRPSTPHYEMLHALTPALMHCTHQPATAPERWLSIEYIRTRPPGVGLMDDLYPDTPSRYDIRLKSLYCTAPANSSVPSLMELACRSTWRTWSSPSPLPPPPVPSLPPLPAPSSTNHPTALTYSFPIAFLNLLVTRLPAASSLAPHASHACMAYGVCDRLRRSCCVVTGLAPLLRGSSALSCSWWGRKGRCGAVWQGAGGEVESSTHEGMELGRRRERA